LVNVDTCEALHLLQLSANIMGRLLDEGSVNRGLVWEDLGVEWSVPMINIT
jgi:hypothetical protein